MAPSMTGRLLSLVQTCTRWRAQPWRGLPSPHGGDAGHGRGSRRRLVGTVGLLALLSGLPPAFAATYYVNPATGANSNSGTKASPWQNPPGTRTTDDSGFFSSTWGTGPAAISQSNRVECGDTILLKRGATQTSAEGGAWLISTHYYTPDCAAGDPITIPITIRVATAAEWSGSGHFTLDGLGIQATCQFGCGYTYGLVHIQDVDTLILGGSQSDSGSVAQRLIILHAAHAQVAGQDVAAHNVLLTSSYNPPTDTTPRTTRFTGQWLEAAFAQNDGIAVGPAEDFIIRDTIAHDNGGSGFSTGNLNDKPVTKGGFQDVKAFRNGPPCLSGQGPCGSIGDQFNFTGCESCYLIRAQSYDGYLRGLNYGTINNSSQMFLLIRDSAFWNNGLTNDNKAVYQSGPCWSGDNATGGLLQRGVMQRSIIALNREGGGPCAYGQGWAEVWNSVWWRNGYDPAVDGKGDIAIAQEGNLDYAGVFNSIVQKRSGQITWTASGRQSGTVSAHCPVSDYNLFVPVSGNGEQLSDFDCIGTTDFHSNTPKTYDALNLPAFILTGSGNLVGTAYTVNFVATHDTDYSQNDFHLQATSSAIDAGTFMFRADCTPPLPCSGSTIHVLGNGGSSDPRHYFLSPTSYYQATPDTIQIEGCGVVTIESMTGPPDPPSITFTPACSWVSGAGIHFPWNGAQPDMGVYEYAP